MTRIYVKVPRLSLSIRSDDFCECGDPDCTSVACSRCGVPLCFKGATYENVDDPFVDDVIGICPVCDPRVTRPV